MEKSASPNSERALGERVIFRMAQVQAKLNQQGFRILQETCGLTLAQWRIVDILGEHGSYTAAQLSRATAMDKGLISRNVKILQQQDIVSVTQDEDDHRASHLALTERGQSAYLAARPQMRDRQRKLQTSLTNTEIKTLLSALDKLECAAEGRES